MAICYFNKEISNRYQCQYEIDKQFITVSIRYDIGEEIETENGVRVYGPSNKIEDRDILIVDHEGKQNILMKHAVYCGHSSVYASLDGGTISKFRASIFFKHDSYSKLASLLETPKASKMKIVSRSFADELSTTCLSSEDTPKHLRILLNKEPQKECKHLGGKNIKTLSICDTWGGTLNDYEFSFQITGYLELQFSHRVNYDELYQYVNEVCVFMQLFKKDKFHIENILVSIDGEEYDFSIPHLEVPLNDRHVDRSVNSNLLDFLENCYKCIPYRKGTRDSRNIPYIVLKRSRGIEDNFLMFYRFIECYYKRKNIKGIQSSFISYAINNNYQNKDSIEDIDALVREIVSLRNYYVHSGYYLKNSSLRVKYEEDSSKNYTVNNIDTEWIYKRTEILYRCTIDIIFRNMLGYTDYTYR